VSTSPSRDERPYVLTADGLTAINRHVGGKGEPRSTLLAVAITYGSGRGLAHERTDPIERAAATLHCVCLLRPYVDRNALTAYVAARVILGAHGLTVHASVHEAEHMLAAVSTHRLELPGIRRWLRRHTRSL
jgi:prophage maintenance system killer protein